MLVYVRTTNIRNIVNVPNRLHIGFVEVAFFIFRHGETDWNAERRFQGHTDIPLNETGRRQANELAKKIKSLDLNAILTSDLVRARETAEICGKDANVPVQVFPQLREANLGDAEGMLREEVIAKYGSNAWARWISVKTEDLDFGYPNGELKSDQLARVLNFLRTYLSDNHDFVRLGISSHGGVVRRVVHSCVGAPADPVPLPNCSIYHLTYNSEQNLWSYVGRL